MQKSDLPPARGPWAALAIGLAPGYQLGFQHPSLVIPPDTQEIVSEEVRDDGDPHPLDRHREGRAGFSLLEILVALFVMTEVIVGVLVLLDSTDRLARSPTTSPPSSSRRA